MTKEILDKIEEYATIKWIDEQSDLEMSVVNPDLREGAIVGCNLASSEIDELKKEVERLKGLIEKLHADGVRSLLMIHGYNTEKARSVQLEAFEEYKQEHNL